MNIFLLICIPGRQHLLYCPKEVQLKHENRNLKRRTYNITEPRRTGLWNIRHKLEDIIIIALCTVVICGGEDFVEMEEFGKAKKEWLESFLELSNDIPDSDTFRRVFHWSLDVIFKEDAAKARKDNSQLNMNVLRKTALSLLNKVRYGCVSKRIIRLGLL